MYGERIRGRRIFGSRVTGVRVGVPRNYEIMRIFENGELGTFSDIRTYETSYFSDAGTTPATIGDPIYQISDQSGNGLNWVQATLTARLVLKQDGSGLYLAGDGGDDTMTTDGSLSAGSYKVYVPTREGIFIDTITHAGGPVSFGPTSYTGGPDGILTALETAGELRLVGPPVFVPAAGITSAKEAALVQWFQNRGAGVELELGPELVTNGTFDTDVSGWTPASNGSFSWESGRALSTVTAGSQAVSQVATISVIAGEIYLGAAEFEAVTANDSLLQIRSAQFFGGTGICNPLLPASITGVRRGVAVASQSDETAYINLGLLGNPYPGSVYIDNVSLRKLQPKGGA